ncbi:MAG TPA: DUF3784 domain-containing protein [Tissierellaceae bacterium]|nr:DUF3784 domain-containing protein [Tissierellaceae bacterium]
MFENIWGMTGIMMAVMFFLFGLLFAVLKEKGASLIAGYNFKSKEERKKYNEKEMSRDMRNRFFIYSLIFFLGTVATYMWGKVWFWIAFVLWLIYFFKDVHIDDEKSFGKYKKEN